MQNVFTIITVFIIINIYAPTQIDIKHKIPNSTNSPETNKLSYIYKTVHALYLLTDHIILINRRKRTHWEVNMWAWTWIWLYHNRMIMVRLFYPNPSWSVKLLFLWDLLPSVWDKCVRWCLTPIKVIDRLKSTSLWPGNMHILSVRGVTGFLGQILFLTGHNKHKCVCMIYANLVHHLINPTWPKNVSS